MLLLVQHNDNVTGLKSRLLISLPAEDNLLTITSALVNVHFQHFTVPDNLQSQRKIHFKIRISLLSIYGCGKYSIVCLIGAEGAIVHPQCFTNKSIFPIDERKRIKVTLLLL